MSYEKRTKDVRGSSQPLLSVTLLSLALALVGCSGDSNEYAAPAPPPPTQPATGGNTAPVITGTPPTTARVGVAYQFTPNATDADSDPLVFSVANLPAWAAFNTASGAITGTPQMANVGTFANIVVSVSDGKTSRSLAAYSLQVAPAANTAPTIGGTPFTTIAAGNEYIFQPTSSDIDGDPLSFVVEGLPAWATFSASTGQIKGTPNAGQVGTYPRIVISVSDGRASASLASFTITVTGSTANRAPTITGSPPTAVTAGNPYLFDPVAADADGNALTFSILNKPTWLTFNLATGRLQGTPTAANVGVHGNIIVRVSDGSAIASLPAFSITVLAVNTAPTITGSPGTSATVGSAYTFTPAAGDAENNPLTFSILNMPVWATFNTANGRLQGTPGSTHVGTSSNIIIRVSDGIATTSLAAFSITVTTANTPPTITGSPGLSVIAGALYTFTPTAGDTDGNPLTFTVSNLPGWMTFTGSNGRVQGTPSLANLGAHANITIRVSDGTATATLAAFTITVTQVGQGAATLNWTAPTLNTDGTQLTNLAGYRVHYGTTSGSYTQTIAVPNPSATSHRVDQLDSGRYYFAITAYDSNNVDSAMTNPVSEVVP